MKKMTRILSITACLTLTLMMLLASFGPAFATVKDEDAYDYTITVYAGRQGEFDQSKASMGTVSEDGKVWQITVPANTNNLLISEDTTGFEMLEGEDGDVAYYMRGFREAGHDNDEQKVSWTIKTVDQDIALEASYGIKGGMVAYVIRYEDSDGNTLREEDTYYGMAGDKPVVSYKYVDNYQPQAYNLTKTLKEDPGENIFTFRYKRNQTSQSSSESTGGTDSGNQSGNGNTAGNAAGNGAAAGNGNAAGNGDGADGANAGNNANADSNTGDAADNSEPAEIEDLDSPTASVSDAAAAEDESESSSSGSGSGVRTAATAGGIVVAAGAIAAALILRRRKERGEN